ncbi:MAG: 50S ribosomal protein L24 [Actinomycetia bacterium]|nr:50S ribosomal protein L24 [Actinomycetes bacterium]MCP4225760.1 50S ribosomal protein L24 [Actinomycetes bacterium]MCP5033650.1 50S ribosomal protein L24 [Actinomycetes bacterium]
MRIRKGDQVRILSGKDRGKEGQVLVAFPATGKVIVEGHNTARRHTKARSQEDPGGIVDKDMPMDVSNVAVISPKDGKPTRVGYKIDGDRKIRVCKRTGAEIPEVSE